jgi:hypothetical protein
MNQQEIIEKYGLSSCEADTLVHMCDKWWRYTIKNSNEFGLINESWTRSLACDNVCIGCEHFFLVLTSWIVTIHSASIRDGVAMETDEGWRYFYKGNVLYRKRKSGGFWRFDEGRDCWTRCSTIQEEELIELCVPEF